MLQHEAITKLGNWFLNMGDDLDLRPDQVRRQQVGHVFLAVKEGVVVMLEFQISRGRCARDIKQRYWMIQSHSCQNTPI